MLVYQRVTNKNRDNSWENIYKHGDILWDEIIKGTGICFFFDDNPEKTLRLNQQKLGCRKNFLI